MEVANSEQSHARSPPLRPQSQPSQCQCSTTPSPSAGSTRQRHLATNASSYPESQRRRVYARPSSQLTCSSIGTSRNPTKPTHTNLVSHLETPWWTLERPKTQLLSTENLERDIFIYHTTQALDVARAAESSLSVAELYLEKLVTEEELSIQVLRDEIKNVRERSRAARHQVASLRAKLQSEGIAPKPPTYFPSVQMHRETLSHGNFLQGHHSNPIHGGENGFHSVGMY